MAEKTDKELLQKFGTDSRHSAWVNSSVTNDTRVLIVGDSYVNGYLLSYFAESFSQTFLIWGDYTCEMEEMIEICRPDIVIYECAERVDRSGSICELAKGLGT